MTWPPAAKWKQQRPPSLSPARLSVPHFTASLSPPPLALQRRYDGHETSPGQAQIVLNEAVITDRRFCKASFESRDLVEDIVKDVLPYWNGEDIFHSLVSYNLTGRFLPLADQLKYDGCVLPGRGCGAKVRSNYSYMQCRCAAHRCCFGHLLPQMGMCLFT